MECRSRHYEKVGKKLAKNWRVAEIKSAEKRRAVGGCINCAKFTVDNYFLVKNLFFFTRKFIHSFCTFYARAFLKKYGTKYGTYKCTIFVPFFLKRRFNII